MANGPKGCLALCGRLQRCVVTSSTTAPNHLVTAHQLQLFNVEGGINRQSDEPAMLGTGSTGEEQRNLPRDTQPGIDLLYTVMVPQYLPAN